MLCLLTFGDLEALAKAGETIPDRGFPSEWKNGCRANTPLAAS